MELVCNFRKDGIAAAYKNGRTGKESSIKQP
jgi:hypothetical protein